jgi:3-phenylpropionate/cinnamic acid dioxygenase small subunit
MLALYTEDATYWVPLEQDQQEALETSSIIRDDKTLLELRVRQAPPPARFRAPAACAHRAPGRQCHGGAERIPKSTWLRRYR